MTREPLRPPTLVTDAPGLAHLVESLRAEEVIGVDTEAAAFFTYHQKACLIQVTGAGQDWIVDPLAEFDLSPLGQVLADPSRVKVFHDAEFDIVLMRRTWGFQVEGLFDTRVAAAVLGSTNPGLANVLEARYGVQLDKSLQRSDWSQRPLTRAQLDYARLDTHYLPGLYRELYQECQDRARLEIVESECRRLEKLDPPIPTVHPDGFVKIKGVQALDPSGRSVLRELFVMRDRIASETDRPAFRVLSNETMLELAQKRPRTRAALGSVRGMTAKVVGWLGEEVLQALVRGMAQEPMRRLPLPPRKEGTVEMDEETQELHERLKHWRKVQAERLGMESAYLLNRHVLTKIAVEQPLDEAALARIEGIEPWQLRDYSKDLLAIVARFRGDLAAGRIKPRRSWRR